MEKKKYVIYINNFFINSKLFNIFRNYDIKIINIIRTNKIKKKENKKNKNKNLNRTKYLKIRIFSKTFLTI
jgi:hypothetical protein